MMLQLKHDGISGDNFFLSSVTWREYAANGHE